MKTESTDALIIVDVQNDFITGTLPVPYGGCVVAPLHGLAMQFQERKLPIFLTMCWHPVDHCSFKEYGGTWPAHCVRGTNGAALAYPLGTTYGTLVQKGQHPAKDAYSGFEDTDLASNLLSYGTRRLFVGGLATDYCVRATVLDALKLGFETVLLCDAVAAVNVKSDDGERALTEMYAAGARARTVHWVR